MNRIYEALLILKTIGTDAEQAQAVTQIEEPIKRLGGQVDRSVSWGRRRLAYEIARLQEGHYHLVEFQMDPARVSELKRLLQLNETIARFLILNRDAHRPVVRSAQES